MVMEQKTICGKPLYKQNWTYDILFYFNKSISIRIAY